MLQRRVSGEGRSAMVNGPNGPMTLTTFERVDSDMGTPTQPTRPAPDRRVGRVELMIGLCNVAGSHWARGAMLPFCRAGARLNRRKTAPAVNTRSHRAVRRKGLGGLFFARPLAAMRYHCRINASRPTTTHQDATWGGPYERTHATTCHDRRGGRSRRAAGLRAIRAGGGAARR